MRVVWGIILGVVLFFPGIVLVQWVGEDLLGYKEMSVTDGCLVMIITSHLGGSRQRPVPRQSRILNNHLLGECADHWAGPLRAAAASENEPSFRVATTNPSIPAVGNTHTHRYTGSIASSKPAYHQQHRCRSGAPIPLVRG